MIIALAAVVLLSPAAPAARAAATPAAKDPIVCKSETPMGSRLPRKSCMRTSERDRLRRESRKTLEDIQSAGDGPFKIP